MRRRSPLLVAGAAAGAIGTAFWTIGTGAVTVDLGWGRTTRALGPLSVEMAAGPDTVFDVISEPYLGRTPQAMAAKLDVLERGSDLVLAAHFTPLPAGQRATTVETVRFIDRRRVEFRLVRGPVPEVTEHFSLTETTSGTRLDYGGYLSADLWALGRWWGDAVARIWVRTVEGSLAGIRQEAERRDRPR